MSEINLVSLFTNKLNQLSLPYMITGSVAGVLYGEPRVTHDVDIVLELSSQEQAGRLCREFPIQEFYCPPEDIIVDEMSRAQRGHFNLIHHQSGFKADIYLAKQDPLHRWALSERREFQLSNCAVYVAPPEYVIIRKLEFYREGQSSKHLRDISAMLHVSKGQIRLDLLDHWIARLGLSPEWKRIANTGELS